MFGNVVDEMKLADEAAKKLRPLVEEVLTRVPGLVRDQIDEVLREYEVVVQFRKKEKQG